MKAFRVMMAIALIVLCCNSSAFAKKSNIEYPSIHEMVGQMILIGFRGLDAEDKSTLRVIEDIKGGYVGGIILFNYDFVLKSSVRNVVSVEQVTHLISTLQSSSPTKLFIAIDQEGGKVRRLKEEHGFNFYPSAWTLGLANDSKNTYNTAYNMGLELAKMGINLNFAPCVDVNINPKSPAIGIWERSFSEDSNIVAKQGKQFMQGLNNAKVITALKHFPGHGSSTKDSHNELPDITNTWQEVELEPYKYLFRQKDMTNRTMVMIAHVYNRLLDPKFPASISKSTIEGLLRERLGWQGVVITDDFQMKALDGIETLEERIFLAIDAGTDILIFGNNLVYDENIATKVHKIILDFVESGRIKPERIIQSWERITALKAQL